MYYPYSMVNLFSFTNYKTFVQKWIATQPKGGRGIYSKLAESLDLSSVMVSQIFNGDREISLEHAIRLAEFLGLTHQETQYLLLLVNYQRAGNKPLREFYYNEIKLVQDKRQESLKHVHQEDIKLSEVDQAVFYSNWIYSAVRLQVSIEGFQTENALVEKFRMSRAEIQKVLDFLVRKNLVVLTKSGYQMGPQRTFLDAASPFFYSRQISWRMKAIEKIENRKPSQISYTCPMSVSDAIYEKLKKSLTETIAEMNRTITTEKPEKLACLNIDLFEI